MEVQIKGIHFDMSDKLEAFVQKKVDRLVRRYDYINTVEVDLRLIKPETSMNKEAGIQLTIAGSPDIYAKKVADTFEEAVDKALEAVEPQVEKFKEKNRL